MLQEAQCYNKKPNVPHWPHATLTAICAAPVGVQLTHHHPQNLAADTKNQIIQSRAVGLAGRQMGSQELQAALPKLSGIC